MLDRVELDTELFDLLRALAIALLDRRRIETLPLRSRDLVSRRVLLALESFELSDEPAPQSLERRNFLQCSVGIHSAVAETSAHCLQILSDKCGIEHETSCPYCIEGPE